MVANRAYKFRIYPNDEQKILFAKTFGCVRMVYNHWLDRKIRQYEENKTNVTYTICAKEMAAMKKTEEYGFLKEADSIALHRTRQHICHKGRGQIMAKMSTATLLATYKQIVFA